MRDNGVIVEQERCARHRMSSKLAMEAVVPAAKPIASSASEFCRREERLAVGARAAQPSLTLLIVRFEGPREVLDLNDLAQQGGCRIVVTIGEQVSANRHQLRTDPKQQGNRDGLIAAVTMGRLALDAIRPNKVAANMEELSSGGKSPGRKTR